VMLISQGGTLVRTPVEQISVLGRNTQGVRLMRVEDGDRLVGLARVPAFDGEVLPGEDTEPLVNGTGPAVAPVPPSGETH
jgi:DNA gyrase subunit A